MERKKWLRRATYASVATAALLVGLKMWAWLIGGSVSMLASLVDSVTDAGASLINLLAVRWALKPADEGHPFGHGKAESLSALAQAGFIGGSSVFLILNALERFAHPAAVQHTGLGMAVTVVAMVLTGALLLLQRKALQYAPSQSVAADSLHYQSDFLYNGVVLLALLLASFGWQWADPLLALLLGFWILRGAWQIGKDAVDTLMDKNLPPVELARIAAAAAAVSGVAGVHDLKARMAGARYFIQLHIELDARLNIVAAHDIAVAVGDAVRALFADAEVIVHQDPVVLADDAGHNHAP